MSVEHVYGNSYGWGEITRNPEQVVPETNFSGALVALTASPASVSAQRPSLAPLPIHTALRHSQSKEEDVGFSMGSNTTKDTLDSPSTHASPALSSLLDGIGSLESPHGGFFSENSSMTQSPPVPARFVSAFPPHVSTSPDMGTSRTLPARLCGQNALWEGKENYWSARTRESRLSVYSAMPSSSASTGNLPEAAAADSAPIAPDLKPYFAPLVRSSSTGSLLLPNTAQESHNSNNLENSPLAPESPEAVRARKKEMRKSMKKEKEEAKAIKKRQKSIAKLQRELFELEKCSSSGAIQTVGSGLETHETDKKDVVSAVPRKKRQLVTSQSLKMPITKSGALISSAPPTPPITPSGPLSPSPSLPTVRQPPKLQRASTWRVASPSNPEELWNAAPPASSGASASNASNTESKLDLPQ